MSQSKRRLRTDFTPGEARAGIAWLCGFALVSVLVEVGTLGTLWGVPSIVAAGVLGAVWTKGAGLWSSKSKVLPTLTWVTGYALLYLGPEVTRELMREHYIPALILLAAGIAGGMWPMLRAK